MDHFRNFILEVIFENRLINASITDKGQWSSHMMMQKFGAHPEIVSAIENTTDRHELSRVKRRLLRSVRGGILPKDLESFVVWLCMARKAELPPIVKR
jgi:hypothetical protein